MSYRIVVSADATRDIRRLDTITQKRLRKKLEYYQAHDDPVRFAKPMVGHGDARYRWRIGMYRVLFDAIGTDIIVLRVDKRSDIYRMFML